MSVQVGCRVGGNSVRCGLQAAMTDSVTAIDSIIVAEGRGYPARV